ncbi:MAG: Fe-S cluster assembly protein SufD, partial [Flavobacteriaceae bacterium]|nr:Fe-S cluster assembly protein SufD [Flavobacteriaceae bacterium]
MTKYMDLKEKLISSFLVFENKLGDELDSNLHQIRSEAFSYFEKNGFPSRKDEEWKYTSLKTILNHEYNVFPKNEAAIEYADVKRYLLHDLDSYKIVFIDGVYSSFLSDTTHEG